MDSLSLDGLDRLQRTLRRRVVERDPANIVAVGFAPTGDGIAGRGPAAMTPGSATDDSPVIAAFEVSRKLRHVAEPKRIHPIETVRLLDRDRSRYQDIALPTRVRQVGEVVPTGVQVQTANDHATTSIVVRWTTVRPTPAPPSTTQPDDPRWRWGLLTVSHLFVGRGDETAQTRARVQRVAACGDGPDAIGSRVAARGRIPGGPDVAIVETGWDRLWLSGFLPALAMPPLVLVTGTDLARFTSTGISGTFAGKRIAHAWRWNAFYPTLMIPTLGRLKHVVSYEIQSDDDASRPRKPFGPGTSGGAIIADGLLIGIQVAAMKPNFEIGYAQTFDISAAWLQKNLRATALDLIHVLNH